MSHSPEPWHWYQGMMDVGDDYVELNSPECPLVRPWNLISGDKTIISSGSGEYTIPSLDDARLIQVAPKLLRALKAYADWHGPCHKLDCPGDDTCNCPGKAVNDLVSEAIWDADHGGAYPWKRGR